MKNRIYTLKGRKDDGRITLSGVSQIKQHFPSYFSITLEIINIEERDKERKYNG